MTESQAWVEIAERLSVLPSGSVSYHLCNRVNDLAKESHITGHTARDMRRRIDIHMDGDHGSAWNATIAGSDEWEDPRAFDICRERRILAALFLSLEARDEEEAA